ncbi:restriction endonuclease subunit S, partial [uncultured Muribaculum sp.]
DKIAKQELYCRKLRNLKTALLTSLFPQGKETKPRVRVDGFNGEWGLHSLSEFAFRITRKNCNLESDNVMTISALYGLINQSEFYNKRIASSDLSGYYLMQKGEFAYNKSYSADYPWGAVKRLDRYSEGVVSNLYIIFGIENIDSDFIVCYFMSNLWHKAVSLCAKEGARNHGLLNISADDFLNIPILIPSIIEEQKAIANIIMEYDHLIQLNEQKLEKLRNLKQAMLDKMFV